MKKFFLFAAAAVAAMTVNATVYDFATITQEDVETTAKLTVEMKDGEPTGKLLIEVPDDQSVVEVILFADIVLHYNSDAVKNIVVDTKNGYFEFPGNGKTAEGKALVTITSANVGDQIYIEAANKGTGSVSIEAVENATGEAVSLPAKANGEYTWVAATYTATNTDPVIKTPSARVRKITVGNSQGVENTEAATVKAVKRIINGQVVIEREGRLFNLLGAEL